MLEFNRQLPAQGAAALGEAAVLEGNPLLPAGDLPEQVLAGFALPAQELLELEAPQPEAVEPMQAAAPAPEVPQEVAEQWLLGMLGQQALQLEAREPQPVSPPVPQLPLPQALPDAPAAQQAQAGSEARDTLRLPSQRPVAFADDLAPVATAPEWQPRPATSLAAAESKQPQPILALAPGVLTPVAGALGTEAVGSAVAEPLSSVAVNAPAALTSAPAAQRLALQTPEARLGEQMLRALRDSVEMQVRQGVQQASIRLDPPELGSMEIFVSHESGRLNVQISAGNIEVARLLQQTSDRLRQELVGGNFLQVNVQVGSEGQSGRQQGRPMAPWQEDPQVRAAQLLNEPAADAQAASDVLITV